MKSLHIIVRAGFFMQADPGPMPLTFRIYPSRNLVFVAYDGMMSIEETRRGLADYQAHPDFHPSQNHLLDLSLVTGWERDFPRIMAMQAEAVDMFPPGTKPPYLVYYAPTTIGQDAAMACIRSWDEGSVIVPRLTTREADALHILGHDAGSFAEIGIGRAGSP